jgi:hypothetical protein
MDQSSRESGGTGAAPSTGSTEQANRQWASNQQHNQGAGATATTELARHYGDHTRAGGAGGMPAELARRAREQTSAAADAIYQQGARAGEYMTRNVQEYPATALLIAGAIGYGMAYLIHGGWSSLAASKGGQHGRQDSAGWRHDRHGDH